MEVTGHANPTQSRWMKVMSRSWSLSEPLCRVCLATAPTSACLPDIRTLPEGLQQFIIDLTSLQMQEDDGLPTGICTNCSDTVMKAYALRKLAQESDVKLRQIRNKPDGSETNSCINSKLEHQEEDKGKGYKRHKCLTCSEEFKFMSALVRHEETHEPQYKCTVCDKIFAFRSSFQRHKLQHTRGGPVLCKLCGSHFLDDMLLRRHINYAHNQKKYGCEVCGGKFSTAAALKSHSKSHIARHERALRCRYDGCGRSFNFAHHLKHHEMTHTGKKQYFCDECGKGFVQSHHLSAHIKQHQPHAWLQCETPSCGKILPSQYALKRHSAVHRKAKPKENNTCCDNTVCSTQKKSQCNKQSLQHKQSIENLKEATEITNKKLNDSLNDFQLNIISTKLTENSLQEINANSLSQDWNEKSNPPTSNIQEQLEISKLESVMDIEEMVTNTNINDNPKSCCSSRKASTVRVAPTTQTKCVVTVEDKLDGTDCKGFFGKCIVGSGTDGTNSEDCICAKVKYEVPIPEYLTAPLLTALEQQGYYPS